MARAGVKTGDEAAGEELGAEEPLAEWERELLAGRQRPPRLAAAEAAACRALPRRCRTVAEAEAEAEVPADGARGCRGRHARLLPSRSCRPRLLPPRLPPPRRRLPRKPPTQAPAAEADGARRRDGCRVRRRHRRQA